MDLNDDGNLTWSEFIEANFGMLDQERALAEEFEFWNSLAIWWFFRLEFFLIKILFIGQ